MTLTVGNRKAKGMDGYKIRFGEAMQAANQLQSLIENLEVQQKAVIEAKETYLNDGNWSGPDKKKFESQFDEYQTALQGLVDNASQHHQALVRMLNTYQNAEA